MPNGSVAVFGAITRNGCTAISPGSCDQTQTPLLSDSRRIRNSDGSLSRVPSWAAGIRASLALLLMETAILDRRRDGLRRFSVRARDLQSEDRLQAKPALRQSSTRISTYYSRLSWGQPALGQSSAVSVVLDRSGNVYVVGSTDDSNFPTTGPVFGVGTPSSNFQQGSYPPTQLSYTFLVKISPDGSGLVFSRLLGREREFLPPSDGCGGNNGAFTAPSGHCGRRERERHDRRMDECS